MTYYPPILQLHVATQAGQVDIDPRPRRPKHGDTHCRRVSAHVAVRRNVHLDIREFSLNSANDEVVKLDQSLGFVFKFHRLPTYIPQ
jgi:hypothetical protein